MKLISFELIQLLLILNPLIILSKIVKLDCGDSSLNATVCNCLFEDQKGFLNMACSTYLENEANKMPDIAAAIVTVEQTFTRWPAISATYLNTTLLDLSLNKIDSIGDLSNLTNLQYLNLSSNLITRINPNICRLIDLYVLDLSFNNIEILNIDDFVCETNTDVFNPNTSYLFSNLQYLFVIGNKIKQINKLDLIFTGMPLLKFFNAAFNKISSINIGSVSENSENVLAKLGHIIELYNNTNYFVSAIKKNTNFYYYFSNNLLTSAFFNLETIYSAIMNVLDISDILLLKFSSIYLENNIKLNCDCNLFNDIDFMVNGPFTESPLYSNLTNSYISLTKCLDKSVKSNIFFDIYNEVKNSSNFCSDPVTTISNPFTKPSANSSTTTKIIDNSTYSGSTTLSTSKTTKTSTLAISTTASSFAVSSTSVTTSSTTMMTSSSTTVFKSTSTTSTSSFSSSTFYTSTTTMSSILITTENKASSISTTTTRNLSSETSTSAQLKPKLDCADSNLNASGCSCLYNNQTELLSMECITFLTNDSNKLPGIQSKNVAIHKAFTQWPFASIAYLNTSFLDLSLNQIDSIGDLSNLANLQYLNLSSNLITRINPKICRLIDLFVLDLSFNNIEILNIEDFVCETDTDVFNPRTNYLFSNLQYFFVIGNKIKQINKLDLIFTGMPMLKFFNAANNQINSINISSLSQNSENVLAKLGKIIQLYNNLNHFISTQVNKKTYYSFSNNLITNVFFNLESLYSTIMDVLDISDILLLKFSSIDLENNQKLNCDCNLFNDIDFIINGPFTESPFYSNLSNTYISSTKCLDNSAISNIFFDIYNEVKNSSNFCSDPITTTSNPSTTQSANSSTTTKSIDTSTYSSSTTLPTSTTTKTTTLATTEKKTSLISTTTASLAVSTTSVTTSSTSTTSTSITISSFSSSTLTTSKMTTAEKTTSSTSTTTTSSILTSTFVSNTFIPFTNITTITSTTTTSITTKTSISSTAEKTTSSVSTTLSSSSTQKPTSLTILSIYSSTTIYRSTTSAEITSTSYTTTKKGTTSSTTLTNTSTETSFTLTTLKTKIKTQESEKTITSTETGLNNTTITSSFVSTLNVNTTKKITTRAKSTKSLRTFSSFSFTTTEINPIQRLDCGGSSLNANGCNCFYNNQTELLIMGCSSFLKNEENKLPDIQAKFVAIEQTYTRWPAISSTYLNTTLLDLSLNQIDSIGDLSNLANLQYLNLSSNLITIINPNICRLIDLYVLDLSFNSIEILNIEDFVCETNTDVFNPNTSYLFSNLQYFFVIGNKIKQINKLDLIFTGMPLLTIFDLAYNKIASINISTLSENSENILAKLGHIIELYDNQNYFNLAIKQNTNFFYSFSNNLITSAFFNLETLYSAIMDVLDIRESLLLKFSSINLENNEKINCDCNLFNDIDFIINGPFTESSLYSNLEISNISLTKCLEENVQINLFYDILNDKKNFSNFCIDSFPTTIESQTSTCISTYTSDTATISFISLTSPLTQTFTSKYTTSNVFFSNDSVSYSTTNSSTTSSTSISPISSITTENTIKETTYFPTIKTTSTETSISISTSYSSSVTSSRTKKTTQEPVKTQTQSLITSLAEFNNITTQSTPEITNQTPKTATTSLLSTLSSINSPTTTQNDILSSSTPSSTNNVEATHTKFKTTLNELITSVSFYESKNITVSSSKTTAIITSSNSASRNTNSNVLKLLSISIFLSYCLFYFKI